jgi:phospholipid/cholesterol/gamma-HCH transport system substrate-binding protein
MPPRLLDQRGTPPYKTGLVLLIVAVGVAAEQAVGLVGAGNPYVYPDNLPRVNARGGPEGRPGMLATDHPRSVPRPVSGAGRRRLLAPYNHFELGQPILIEYVWGRQIGEFTINP